MIVKPLPLAFQIGSEASLDEPGLALAWSCIDFLVRPVSRSVE